MLTASLICMENTFWNNSRDGNFMELFKKTFIFYDESGMRKKVEANVDILKKPEVATTGMDFEAKFCKIIVKHRLCKIHHCFYLHSRHLITFLA